MRLAINALVVLFVLSAGCTQLEMGAATYTIEGVGYLSLDRYKRSNDVVLVKGLPGKPNRLYMRRGMNPLWGPSELLGQSGLSWWDYVETNRRVQIYSDVAHAVYGKHNFMMSPDAAKAWEEWQAKMEKKYPKQVDYAMFEHLVGSEAALQESTSELKQEKKMFAIRNKPEAKTEPVPVGVTHDILSRSALRAIGFVYEKK